MKTEVVLSQKEITKVCQKLGKNISDTLRNEEKVPVFLGVMKGALNFMMDLIKYIDIDIYTDYIHLNSYDGTSSTGKITLLKDIGFDLTDRVVVIIEDIIDSGVSMEYLIEHLQQFHPKDIYVCCLFNKVNAREKDFKVDFVGKVLVKNDFLIGYGLDYYEIFRNLPYVLSVADESIPELQEFIKTKK